MVKIVTVPYEVTLRWACDKGETAGRLRGLHKIMKDYAVDEAGTIIGPVGGEEASAADFPVEELKKFLGDEFVHFHDQLAEATKTNAAAAGEARRTQDTLQSEIDRLRGISAGQAEMLAQNAAEIRELRAILDGRTKG